MELEASSAVALTASLNMAPPAKAAPTPKAMPFSDSNAAATGAKAPAISVAAPRIAPTEFCRVASNPSLVAPISRLTSAMRLSHSCELSDEAFGVLLMGHRWLSLRIRDRLVLEVVSNHLPEWRIAF